MKRLNLILDYADHPERYSVTPPKSLVATALVLLLLSGAFALCQERKDDSATPDTRTSYEKTADGLIARFAKNDFSDEKFTDTMKQQKVSETCEMLWKDFGKQFGSFLDWKTVKTESVLQFQRVHQRCEFEKGYVTYMIVVDKSDNIAGMFVISVDKKEEKEKGNDDIKSYPVNKSVTEFPSEVEDLSTPEAAYVAFNRATCLQDPAKIKEAMIRLSIPAYRSGFEQETFSLAEPEWAKVLANAEILEVNQYRDEMATVVAKLQDDNVRKPFDVRNLEKIDGKWLNAGNDRCDSLEKARGVFRVVFLERMERKDLLNSALAKEVVSREVEKNVSEFPEKEDLSSPEAAYANFNRAMRLQDGTELKTAMVRLSVPRLSEVIARENPTPGPADWNEILKNAKIKTTFVFRDSKAIVIAFLPGDQVRKPFDVRLFEKIDGKWLNKGNDRFNSLEDARMEFLRRVNNEYGNTPLPTFDETEATVKTP